MEINIEAIKKDLEATDGFKLWNKEIGLTFEDFSIYDYDNNITIKEGKTDIGNYNISFKDGKRSAYYDLDNESVRKHNLKRIGA